MTTQNSDIESLLQRYVTHFSNIEDGWYDDTSPKPTTQEISNFVEIIKTINNVHGVRYLAAAPYQLGGIWIDWDNSSMHIHKSNIRLHMSNQGLKLPAKEMIQRFRDAPSFQRVDMRKSLGCCGDA
jgi:hypothetical protein